MLLYMAPRIDTLDEDRYSSKHSRDLAAYMALSGCVTWL